MTSFERISCGIPELDPIFDNIRLGDNVVWQLSTLSDFPYFVDPFVQQCITDGHKLIYVRFASHEPLVQPQPGVTIYELNPHKGFEAFTIEVRNIITHEGIGACYVFDCLSELQAAWSADLMMGNFFRVTCPYLFELDTVAYFPIIRGGHSFRAIAKIRDTTQLLIDVYSDRPNTLCAEADMQNETSSASIRAASAEQTPSQSPDQPKSLYIHPLKVWNRYSETMFLAHRYFPESGSVSTLTDGMEASKFYTLANRETKCTTNRNIDSWDRFFAVAQSEYEQGSLTENTCSKMCNMMVTKDPKVREMVKRFFTPTDYFEIRDHMVGTGLIGGKACGMLLARKIIQHQIPEAYAHLEPHDSFYIGSDVFYYYLVFNDLWTTRIKQRSEEGFVSAAPELAEGFLNGTFPDDVREQFTQILDYYGQAPIIVRSSSFLEDGFNNAFAGKYESVFCTNIGPLEDRLAAFEDAIRRVYASTMDPSALEYRRRNGLDHKEEQMALLVQRVSGSHYGSHMFMPNAAGVGYSHSIYRWSDKLDPGAGMLRLVAGLGTKAVDRTQADYPRLVSLDRPLARVNQTWADRHRYSQHNADMLDLEKRALSECNVLDLAEVFPRYAQQAVFEHDREAEDRLRERGQYRPVLFASCQGLVENREFITLMRDILSTLEHNYQHPVDIEYTINIGKDGQFVVNLLQCRPLHLLQSGKRIDLPELPEERTFFKIDRCAMGRSRAVPIDVIVSVDPIQYYNCPHIEKPTIAHLIGSINAHYRDTEKNCLLLVPGRIGTSSPELGVPVSFADICDFAGICEVACSQAGYSPELSYGSHLFQDLVEADIYYGALLEDERQVLYRPSLANEFTEVTDEVLANTGKVSPEIKEAIHVYETRQIPLMLWHDLASNSSVCGIRE